MPKTILKDKEIALSNKYSKYKKLQKCQKMAKNWQKLRTEFFKNQKKAWTFSYFYTREAIYKISENLAHQTWRKCVTNERTNGRTGLKS